MEESIDAPLQLLESLKKSAQGKSKAELLQMTNSFSSDQEMLTHFMKQRVANKINDALFSEYDSSNVLSALR